MYGCQPEELMGKSIVDLEAAQEDKDRVRAYLKGLLREQPPPRRGSPGL
jgi:hypothetical protein